MYPALSSARIILAGVLALALGGATTASAQGDSGLLLVANKGSQSLSLVDPVAAKEIATIAEDGITGHEVIASLDGKLAYVPIFGNSGVGKPGTDGQLIRVMDLQKRAIVHTIDFGKGVRPHLPVVNRKDGLLYVTTELENSVTVIDPKKNAIVGQIPTGHPESHMLALSHDGLRGYTANVASGTVSVLDLVGRKLVTSIPVATITQRIAVSPDDRWVVTADQTKLRLIVIDAKTNTVAHSIPLPGIGYGTAFTPDGRFLVVGLPSMMKVGFVDMTAKQVVKTVDVPKSPQGVLMRPDGAVVYVSCDISKQVAAIDVKTFTVAKLIDVGAGADGLAWAVARR